MFTSHTYELSNNIQIFFTDSGPPPHSDNYTTLVVFHGSAFNGAGYEKLHSVAHPLNLRTVIWNRRDYPGSTPYTDSELEDLRQGRRVFMEKIGVQVGEFLEQFIENENIPKVSSDHKAGGIAIMGCSMGNSSAMALFSDPKLSPPETYLKLKPYIKDLVLYEPPHLCFAYPLPPGVDVYNPLNNSDQTIPGSKAPNFKFWVSSFYNHRDINSADLRDMDTPTKGSSDATITKWSQEEFQRYVNETATVRSELPMFVEPMQTTLKELSDRVFYDEGLTRTYFPDLKLTMVVGTRSNWMCTWGSLETQRIHDLRVEKGAAVRPMKTYRIIGGNHYAHWEDPNTLLKKALEGMTRDN
ncbi:hypothetical protein E1B28_011833 [Marasmius oreades]|uniref:AB hydrolase-1 domain-containing protein n=1 Tax=Marasmius oreades TaxID=181124 RepID=A0A9P7RVJ2_9AGAR|nr:uncharacterized protein E1B28_011833 [Marasmius oreades]KAG7090233.1 hypothetical protein E1B28_011833 [Marasmius oreades]